MQQLLLLAAIFLIVSLVFDLLCVVFADWLRPRQRQEGSVVRVTRFLSAAVHFATSLMAITGFIRVVPQS